MYQILPKGRIVSGSRSCEICSRRTNNRTKKERLKSSRYDDLIEHFIKIFPSDYREPYETTISVCQKCHDKLALMGIESSDIENEKQDAERKTAICHIKKEIE